MREKFNQSKYGGQQVTVLPLSNDEATQHADSAKGNLFQSRRIGIHFEMHGCI